MTTPKSIRESPGEWLFHYTRLSTAIEHILPSRRMRLSPFSQMRDPREYANWSIPAAGFPGEASEEEITKAWANASTRLNVLKTRFKLLSFTEDDPETPGEYGRGYSRSRLWEMYAEAGKGVCLAFHKPTAIEEITSQLSQLGRIHHGPVMYRNERLFEQIFVDLNEALAGRLEEVVQDKLARHMDDLFFAKNTEWASESEYRFAVETGDGEPVEVDVTASLAGVCLGHETSQYYFPAIRELCLARGITVTKLLWWNNDPVLVGIKLD